MSKISPDSLFHQGLRGIVLIIFQLRSNGVNDTAFQ